MAVTQVHRGVERGRAQQDVTSGRSNADVSQREDLASFISMITRDETPFMSSIGKTKCTSIFHEWQADKLEAPGNSRVAEGYDYADPVTPNAAVTDQAGPEVRVVGPSRTRLGAYCQINAKTIAVSGTRRAIDQAGVADEYAYQLKKRGTEMRRDIEHDLVQSVNISSASSADSDSPFNVAIRTMPSFRAWINVNRAQTSYGNAGGTVVLNNATEIGTATNQGIGTFVATHTGNSSKVSLSLSDIDQVMQNIYEEGGKASRIMVSPKLRRDFSDLLVTDTGVRRNIDEKGKLRQSVDVYMSDFGDLMVIPNYIMGLSTSATEADNLANEAAFIYDPQWFSMGTLRPMQEVQVGQKGDSTVGMFVEEQTFMCKNALGCGAIYGLN